MLPATSQRQAPVDLGSYFTHGIRFKLAIDYLTKLAPATVLVVGCEWGYLESQLPECISITSIDNEERYVRDSALRCAGMSNREFIHLDLFDIPQRLGDRQFDVVVICEVIEHVEDDRRTAKIAFDALRPGGELLLTVPNIDRFPNRVRKLLGAQPRFMSYGPGGHLREYTPESVHELVSSAGFVCERMVGVDFWLPFDRIFRPIIPTGFTGRRIAGQKWWGSATWFQLHCRKPGEPTTA